MQFISDNKFDTFPQNPTSRFQRTVRTAVNNCQTLIPQDRKWTAINLNPTPPYIRGLIKLHKPGLPIRPIVNWTNAPAYKIAKILLKKCAAHIPLPYAYNIKNSTHLISDLNEIPLEHDLKFASFDIKNMYQAYPLLN
jgi:hypothetical protein